MATRYTDPEFSADERLRALLALVKTDLLETGREKGSLLRNAFASARRREKIGKDLKTSCRDLGIQPSNRNDRSYKAVTAALNNSTNPRRSKLGGEFAKFTQLFENIEQTLETLQPKFLDQVGVYVHERTMLRPELVKIFGGN